MQMHLNTSSVNLHKIHNSNPHNKNNEKLHYQRSTANGDALLSWAAMTLRPEPPRTPQEASKQKIWIRKLHGSSGGTKGSRLCMNFSEGAETFRSRVKNDDGRLSLAGRREIRRWRDCRVEASKWWLNPFLWWGCVKKHNKVNWNWG